LPSRTSNITITGTSRIMGGGTNAFVEFPIGNRARGDFFGSNRTDSIVTSFGIKVGGSSTIGCR